MRLGLAFPTGLRLEDAVDVAAAAERMGYADCWSSEVAGHDAFTPLAAVAARTTRIRLGTAVVPAATRPPALLAMTGVALQNLSGGRFCLGLGSSTEAIVSRWMGLAFPPTLARMRETIAAIRAASGGGKVVLHGHTIAIDGFRLETEPQPIPIYVGALGPRMVRLAGEAADGLVLTMASLEWIPRVVSDFMQAAANAGREPDGLDIVLTVPLAVGDADALDAIRISIASYGVLDVYNRYLDRQGFKDEARDLRDAFTRRSRADAVKAVSDRLLATLSVSGEVAECRDRLASYRDAGIKTLLLAPVVQVTEEPARKRRILEVLDAFAGNIRAEYA